MPQVLFVEDVVEVRGLLARIFRDQGYVVREASTLEEAQQQLLGWVPDIVLTDLHLGGSRSNKRDGITLARALKADPAYEQTRFIAFTGGDLPEGLTECFDAIVIKPARAIHLTTLFSLLAPRGSHADVLVNRVREIAREVTDLSTDMTSKQLEMQRLLDQLAAQLEPVPVALPAPTSQAPDSPSSL